jgi:beta-glucanase (GH16 family)
MIDAVLKRRKTDMHYIVPHPKLPWTVLLSLIAIILVSTISCDLLFPGDDYVLIWSDEFNGTALSSANWNIEIGDGTAQGIPGWGNNELQYYRTENISFEDFGGGERGLVIEARDDGITVGPDTWNYTSSRIQSKDKAEFAYGRIEARIKMPKGQGIWPAFWMLGHDIDTRPWPASGEIDIVELVGHEPARIHGTIHYGTPYSYRGNDFTLGSGDFSDDFHIFAIEWDPGEIRWYVDETLYSLQRSWYSAEAPYPGPFDKPFFLLFNVAVGGNWPGSPDGSKVFPQRMLVDYVRVYQAR